MPRKKPIRTSDDLAREIARLEQQRAQVQAAEHARRGELVAQYLSGPRGDELRQVIEPLVSAADRELFGLTPADRVRRRGGTSRNGGAIDAAV